MKRLLIAIILLVTAPVAIPQVKPSFFDQITGCVNISVVFTQFATLAETTPDNEKPAFLAYIQQVADRNQNPRTKAFIVNLGDLAWASRGESVRAQAMKLYEDCFNSLGTKT